ncbi:DUF5606 family protein [Gynurincola endophyticus]|uniref:DUF5606 family protein n=1 Tax=Gynurincola endophyticus TaxID=2479004 RepID=UPI000F8CE299|nr:DUF5606 domain-containing protein [Gynurincola endophyticus]
MEYGKIIAVTGLPGLFELVSSKSNGAIVRSLEDNTTKFVASRVHNFSHLESIEVYTVRENVNLIEVFIGMKNSSEAVPDGKDAAALKAYFEKVVPELDFERVYASDLKKMVKWFAIIDKNNIELKRYEESLAEETEAPAPVEEEAPAPKKTAKKAAAKEPKAEAAEEETPAPKKAAKKAAPKAKKADAEGEEAPAPKKAAKKAAAKSTKKSDGE